MKMVCKAQVLECSSACPFIAELEQENQEANTEILAIREAAQIITNPQIRDGLSWRVGDLEERVSLNMRASSEVHTGCEAGPHLRKRFIIFGKKIIKCGSSSELQSRYGYRGPTGRIEYRRTGSLVLPEGYDPVVHAIITEATETIY